MAVEPTLTPSVRIDSLNADGSTLHYWVPVGLYAALIFGGSSISHPPEAVASILKEVSDKALHVSEYAILGALAYRACRHAAGPWVARHALIVAAIGCSLYGLSDEVHQLFVPFREGDPLDLVADTAGALMGAWTWRWKEWRHPEVPEPS
jgi:VanZ family protein